MISIESFRGDPGEAATFSIACWQASYAGRNLYPIWDESYMQWQLFQVPDPEVICRLGAYENGHLIGFFAAELTTFRTPDGPRLGTMSSWLSVTADRARSGIGGALRRAMWDWQRSRGADFMIGFVDHGTVRGKGRRFWTRQVDGAVVRSRPGLWCHVLDPHRASAAEISALEACSVRLLARLQRRVAPLREGVVREYAPSNWRACRAIFDRLESADFGYAWSNARLAHQLAGGAIVRTLVLDAGSGAEALFNCYPLTLVGRMPLRCAIVDFFGAAPGTEHRLPAFLRACLDWLRREGFDAALTLGPPVHGATTLLRGGFVPLPPAQQDALIFLPVAPGVSFPPVRCLHLHWR